jgi:hypothetical protein
MMSAPERDRIDSTVVDQVGQHRLPARPVALTLDDFMSTKLVDNTVTTQPSILTGAYFGGRSRRARTIAAFQEAPPW